MDYEFIVDSEETDPPTLALTGWESVVFELEDEEGPADAGP
jgi:hypothetical protein